MTQQDMSVVFVAVSHDHKAFRKICERGNYVGTKDDRVVFTLPGKLSIKELGLTRIWGRRLGIEDYKIRMLIMVLY